MAMMAAASTAAGIGAGFVVILVVGCVLLFLYARRK